MGNSPSGGGSHERRSGGSGGSGGNVKKRVEKVKRAGRPMSFPGIGTDGSRYPTPELNPRLTGSTTALHQGHNKEHDINVKYNPLNRNVEGEERAYNRMSPVMKRESFLDNNKEYKDSLEHIIDIWPEYAALRQFNVTTQREEVQRALQAVFKRMHDQHVSLGGMSRNLHDAKHTVQLLDDQINSKMEDLEESDEQITRLNEDITYLKGELVRRGIHPHLPSKRFEEEDMQSHGEGSPRTPRSQMSESTEQINPSLTQRLRQKEKTGHMMPTPLLLAEGRHGLGDALRRANSKLTDRPHSAGRRFSSDLPSRSEEAEALAHLDSTVQQLENSLKKSEWSNPGSRALDEIIDQFVDMEAECLNVLPAINRLMGQVPRMRKQRFLCAVITTAYNRAHSHMQEFRRSVRTLLSNPLESLDSVRETRGAGRQPPVRFFYAEPKRARGIRATEVPVQILDEATHYLEGTAGSVSLATLIQDIVEELQEEFRDVATSSVLNHNEVSAFIHDCGRLAWRMVLQLPPLYVSTDRDGGLDLELHDNCNNNIKNPRARHAISYFVWPTLLTRREGEVLQRGKVMLSLASDRQTPYM